MKKTLIVFGFVAFAAIALSSCKKDYTCECTTTMPGLAPQTTTTVINAKKSDATTTCENGSQTVMGIVTVCKLK